MTRAFAQTSSNTADDLGALPNETPAARQARLEAELTQVEQEEAAAQATLDTTKSQSASLERDITILNSQIKVAQLNIQAKNILIQTLGQNITQKQQTISDLTDQINQGKDTLAQLLRKTNELDAVSLPEVVLSEQSITGVFGDFDTFQSVETSLQTTFQSLTNTQNETQTQKDQLTTQQNQQIDAKAAIVDDENNIKTAQAQKQTLLTVSKNSEKTYTQVVAAQKAKAAQISAALFALAGGGKAIPFGTALGYADEIKQKTGVDPAFLLAILTQESNLGSNVGKCYLTDTSTGAGINPTTGKTYPNVMKPSRDVLPYLNITQQLGLNPLSTFVSCPIAGAGGWGGAMGPAQFIASTWVLFTDRISSLLNVSIPDPWSPRDAFTASALYLSDLGAVGSSYSSELRAACKYYGSGGSTCSYGRSVMSIADSIQRTMIDPLQGV